MKKLVVLIGIISLCFGLVFSEEQKQSFEEKHQDKDLIFLEYSETIKVNEDWSYRKEEYKKLKILKEEARSMGEIPIPYDKKKDRIVEISAYTITPDGKKHKYTKINDISPYASYPIYSNAMIKMVTMPEVNVGSVIECKVVIESKGSQIKNAFWKELHFTPNVPTKLFKITLIFPKKLDIQYKEFNLTYKPKITQNHTTITYLWEIPDAYDERKAEEYVPPPRVEDLSEVVEVSSIKKWSDVSDWYYALVQKNLKITREIEGAAKKVIAEKATLKDKVKATLEYIQDNFRYVSMSLGAYSLEPHPTDQVFKNKYGDCKDLSLLCMAMLKAVGINSYVALFNNEFSISDPKYDLPFPNLFDHAILFVEDKINGNFYIDPLLNGYDIGEFPLTYQGAYTFIINEQGGRFDRFPIFDEKRNATKTVRRIELNEDGSALFDTEYIWELGSSIKMRDTMKAMDKETESKFYQALDASIISGGQMIERRVEGLDKKYGLIKGYAKYKKKDAFPLDGNMMIIDISGYTRDLDFTQKERKNSIFFPVNSLVEEITTYKIPTGFIVSHLPNNISLNRGFFEMKRECKRAGDTITVTEATRHKRSQYPKEDYVRFKDFFDKLPGKTQQRIILKKTKSWQKKISEIWAIIRE